MKSVLEVRNVKKVFGAGETQVTALQEVNLTLFGKVPRYRTLGYHKVDLRKMAEVGLIPQVEGKLEKAAVFPRKYADGLGVKVGDLVQVTDRIVAPDGESVGGNRYLLSVGAAECKIG